MLEVLGFTVPVVVQDATTTPAPACRAGHDRPEFGVSVGRELFPRMGEIAGSSPREADSCHER